MASRTVLYARAAPIHLRRADPVLARIIGEVGPLRISLRRERFQALVRAILFQQLAGHAAQSIYERFVGLFPAGRFPSPRQVLDMPPERLLAAGLSRAKAAYVRDLAEHVARGALDFRRFARMDDEEIIQELTRVRGIGRWTAEMFLMFNLGRPDVLPVDDLGFRNAVRKAYGMRERPGAHELRQMAERWRPYRSAAVWYLWQSLRITLPDGPPAETRGVHPKKARTRRVRTSSARRERAPAGS
jgi:DNA-3-methyladenine glycosylase II